MRISLLVLALLATAPAAQVEDEVRMPPRYPAIVGRIVDAANRPVCSRWIDGLLVTPGSLMSSGAQTDRDGRFRCVFEEEDRDADPGRQLELTIRGLPGFPGVSRATVDLGRAFPSGDLDVGDVQLRSGGHVLSGRVVDEDDQPIAGAKILVYRGAAYDPTSRERCVYYGKAPVVSLDDPERVPTFNWSPETDLFDVESDQAGRFALHAICPPGSLRIWVGKDGYCSEMARVVRRGARDERFVLRRAASLVGSVVVGASVPRYRLTVRAVGEAAAVDYFTNPVTWTDESPPPRATASKDGRLDWDATTPRGDALIVPFRIDGLRAGRCDVELNLHPQPQPVRRLDGISVTAGETQAPPVLQRIDVTRQIRRISLTIAAPSGECPVDVELRVVRGRERLGAHYRRFDPRRRPEENAGKPWSVEYAIDDRSRLDVIVLAKGYRAVRLNDVRESRHVVLQPGLPIEVHFAPRAQRDGGASLTIEPIDGSDSRFRFPNDRRYHYLGSSLPPTATYRLPAPGRYRLALRCGGDQTTRDIVVTDTSAVQVFAIGE